MRVTFWGVRGSIATSGLAFTKFGGNTTCLEIEAGGSRLIIDGGTGLRGLGQKLSQEAKILGRPVSADILFTHLHWDHVQGFPFFGPGFSRDTRLRLYGPQDADGSSLEDVLRRQMTPPTFPVGLDSMPAQKEFYALSSGDAFTVGEFTVHTRALDHPQGSLGFRVEAMGRSLCFATDTEHPSDGSIDEALQSLAHDVDLLICDAQYTEAEYEGRDGGPSRRGWGHSTYVAATKAARATGAKRLILTHHDPGHDDATMERIEREARGLFSACRAAREAMPYAV